METGTAFLPPVVITEVLSRPALSENSRLILLGVPVLDLHEGYWHRAGSMRADVKRLKLRSGLADVLIAQSCIDHDIPLVTYDLDFRHFETAGLKLL